MSSFWSKVHIFYSHCIFVRAHHALSQVAAARTGHRFGPGWRRQPGRQRNSWIQQIGDGTPFSIRAEWSKVRRCGHSGLTQRTSAVYAIWWWWWVRVSASYITVSHLNAHPLIRYLKVIVFKFTCYFGCLIVCIGCVVLFTGWFHRCIRLEHFDASLMHRWNQPVNKTTHPYCFHPLVNVITTYIRMNNTDP